MRARHCSDSSRDVHLLQEAVSPDFFLSHTYAFNYESIQEFIVYRLYAVLVNVAELYIDYKVPKIRITKHR